MDLSIIIVSYNTRALLDRCLDSVQKSLINSTIRYEIIVLDNVSHDGTRELLNKKYDRVIKVYNKSNLGFGKSNNLGIKMARGKTILLLNSDTKVLNNAIGKLFEYHQDHVNAFIGGKLFNEDGTPQSSCGPMFMLPIVFFMLFLKGDSFNITRYSPNRIRFVDWVSGACIMGTKEAFLRVGLFDDKIFMYMEEIDLLYRAKQKGYNILFYPSAQFIHTGAASSGSRKQPVINIYKGLRYFYSKHRSFFEQQILKTFLISKALIARFIAKIIKRSDLESIYEEALRVYQ